MVAVREAHHRKIHVVVAHPSLTLHTPPQLHTHTLHTRPYTVHTHINTHCKKNQKSLWWKPLEG